MKKIFINKHNIARNLDDGGARPVIYVEEGTERLCVSNVKINGPSEVVYDITNSGPAVWIQTESDLELTE